MKKVCLSIARFRRGRQRPERSTDRMRANAVWRLRLRRVTYCFWPELLRCFVVCSVTLKPGGANSVVSAGSSD